MSICLRQSPATSTKRKVKYKFYFKITQKGVCAVWNEDPNVLNNEATKTGYNKFVLGVDKKNQMVPYYLRRRKFLKLTKKFISFLPQTAALNIFIEGLEL